MNAKYYKLVPVDRCLLNEATECYVVVAPYEPKQHSPSMGQPTMPDWARTIMQGTAGIFNTDKLIESQKWDK